MTESPAHRAADSDSRPADERGAGERRAVRQEAGGPRRGWIGLAVLIVGVGVGLLWSFGRGEPPPPPQPVRTSIPIPEGAGPWPNLVQPLAISRDGERLVFHSLERSADGLEPGLWSRALPDGDAVRIPGTERAGSHFLSPDGAWIVFHDIDDGALRRIPVEGGESEILVPTDATGPSAFLGGAWTEDGSIVYALRTGLRRLFLETGVDEALTATNPLHDIRHLEPRPLPDGSGVAYTVGRTSSPGSDIAVLKFEGASTILGPGHSPRPVPGGTLVFGGDDGTLRAARALPDWSGLLGDPMVVQEGVLGASMPYPRKTYALADDGTLAFLPSAEPAWSEILWVDRSGAVETIVDTRDLQLPPGGRVGVARLSPNGEKVALRIGNPADVPAYKLFVFDLASRVLSPLSVDADADWPVWTPSGESIVFNRFGDSTAGHELYRVRADDLLPPEPLTAPNPAQQHAQAFTPDGRWLVVQQRDTAGGEADLWRLPVGHDAEPHPLVETPASELHAALSPDGRWLAYVEGGTGEGGDVVVTDFPEARMRTTVSSEPAHSPLWSPLGDELFYRRAADGAVMAVEVAPDSTFHAGVPEPLFTGRFDDGSSYGRSFDVSPDAERFLMIGEAGRRDGAPRVAVVHGWLQDVQRRLGGEAPGGR